MRPALWLLKSKETIADGAQKAGSTSGETMRVATVGAARRSACLGVALALLAAAASAAMPVADPPGGASVAVVSKPGAAPVTLHAESWGAGPPVLLLHGLGESIFTWHDLIPELARRHRVIALDLKGFGRSDKPDDGAYSADDQAALVARFILDQGLDGVSVIGHSFGGTVALRTALADGIKGTSRIRRIAVIGAPALPRATAGYLDLVKTPAIPDAMASSMKPDMLARLLLREAMGGRSIVSDEDVEGYAAPYREPAALAAFLATARAIVEEKDADAVAARYRTLKLPALVVWCRQDPIVPLKSGRRLAKTLPGARLAILEGCHHLPQHERPKELLATLGAFLGD
jgi:pimeloyl-ACP methyl ester carboxylesterase